MSMCIAEVDQQIHTWIVSGDFQRWRRRTARPCPKEPKRAANGRELRKCEAPGCRNEYQVHPKKKTPYCYHHSMVAVHARRQQELAPCKRKGCKRMIYVRRNKDGLCVSHRPKKAKGAGGNDA